MFARIMPFIAIGIFISFLILSIVVFSYIFVIGAIIGLVLYLFTWIRKLILDKQSPPKHVGNIYDAE